MYIQLNLDDILVLNEGHLYDYMNKVQSVLKCIQITDLKENDANFTFFTNSMKYLGNKLIILGISKKKTI